ncbi:MAG: DNA translocase FtsK 4TM domain-containing protein, partial [Lachnospiraceae bacterium]|nr:DNA translocase FtsK 4TM domain-containing protein [Lachnospiraceae bacterium]
MAASKSAKKNTKSNNKSKNTRTSRRKTSGSSSAKKRDVSTRSSAAREGREAFEPTRMQLEVFLWISLLVSILLCIGNFGFGGAVGDKICRFFFGCFGVLAYAFPFMILAGTFFMVSNIKNSVATAKLISAVVFMLFVFTFIELFIHKANTIGPISAFHIGFDDKLGGGFFGGAIALVLVKAFGLVGAYVIDVILIIISLVLITETKTFLYLHKRSEDYKADMARREKDRARRRAEREAERAAKISEKKEDASGDKPRTETEENAPVLPDTTINTNDNSPSDEVNEIHINMYDANREIEAVNRVSLTSGTDSASVLETTGTSFEFVPEEVQQADTFEPESEPVVESVSVAEPEPEIIPEPEHVYEPDPEMAPVEPAPEPEAPIEQPQPALKKEEPAPVSADDISKEFEARQEPKKPYVLPSTDLLDIPKGNKNGNTEASLMETANKLQKVLSDFGVDVKITDVSCGPTVTRYELEPAPGVKVSRITNLSDDIKLNLAAADIRIEAPIPGKSAVGIEVPNKSTVMVSIRELIEDKAFTSNKSKIAFSAGRDIGGNVIISDIAKMPHLLIAGSTGSGKSVCINTIIMSILYRAKPDEVKFIMIDPKVVELSVYNGIPHLLIPVVTDPKKASGALQWAVHEMTDRYKKFADSGVRDMAGYNSKIKKGHIKLNDGSEVAAARMPQIVVIVDELADLMMVSSSEVEEAICRLAQLARAAGIHLIIATQRPSVNVITGLIKANMPSRIAFAVTSGVDSRTILDMIG